MKGQGHRGQRSNFCISAVLGPICMKLGECIQVDPLLRFMGPIGSKVIEYRGQRSNLCCFFLFPPRSLGRSSPNLEGRWRAVPDISLRGSFFDRSRSSRSKVKFMLFFFLFVPLLLPGPWTDLHQTWWEGGGRPRILARGVHFLKVKVIEVKGQISVSRSSRSKVKFLYLGSPWSDLHETW